MKTKKETAFNGDWNVCVMRGFYDEAGEYCEEMMENIHLSRLPEKAIPRVDLTYDVTTLYSKEDVLVIAKSMQEISEYKKLGGTPRFFHSLLHKANSDWYDGYMCIVSNLKTLRKWHKKNRKI